MVCPDVHGHLNLCLKGVRKGVSANVYKAFFEKLQALLHYNSINYNNNHHKIYD